MNPDVADLDVAPTTGRRLPEAWQLAANIWFVLLVGYLVVLPAGLKQIGIPLFALTGACGVVRFLMDTRESRRDVRVVILGFAAAGAVPVILGIIASTPGWRDVAVPLVGGPVLWYFVSRLPDRRAIGMIPTALAAGTIALWAIVMLLLTDVGTDIVHVLEPGAYGFALDGATRSNFPGVSSLTAVIPFLAVLLFDEFRHRNSLRRRRFVAAGLALGIVAALLSGRQGVVGVIALTPVLMLVASAAGFNRQQPARRDRKRSLTYAAVAMLVLVLTIGVATQLGLEPGRVPGDVLAAVGLVEDRDARIEGSRRIRELQGESLLAGWRERPLVGHGAGAVSPDFFTWRGFELGDPFTVTPRPWRAELAYHLLLFESGLLGVAVYLGATIVAMRALAHRYRDLGADDQMLCRAAVVAALALAFGTAVNPFARAVGHQLMFFLPVYVVAVTMQRDRAAKTTGGDEGSPHDDLIAPEDASADR